MRLCLVISRYMKEDFPTKSEAKKPNESHKLRGLWMLCVLFSQDGSRVATVLFSKEDKGWVQMLLYEKHGLPTSVGHTTITVLGSAEAWATCSVNALSSWPVPNTCFIFCSFYFKSTQFSILYSFCLAKQKEQLKKHVLYLS